MCVDEKNGNQIENPESHGVKWIDRKLLDFMSFCWPLLTSMTVRVSMPKKFHSVCPISLCTSPFVTVSEAGCDIDSLRSRSMIKLALLVHSCPKSLT